MSRRSEERLRWREERRAWRECQMSSGVPHGDSRCRRPRAWRFLIVLAIFVAIAFSMRDRSSVTYAYTEAAKLQQFGSQSYMSGLTVQRGQTLGDAVVYSGDATVQSGGRIDGNLVVYSGDAEVQTGAEVTGDLTAWAGDISVDGRVGGNVTALAGDVDLGGGASVGGDVSSLGGEVDRSESATVEGNVLGGKQAFSGHKFGGIPPLAPLAPMAPAAPMMGGAAAQSTAGISFFSHFFALVGRLFGAFFLTILATLAAMVVYTMRPTMVEQAQKAMRANLPRSFALGITVNVALWLAMRLLGIAFCLRLIAVVPALALIVLVAVGLAVIGRSLGQRLLPSAQASDRRPVLDVALGAFLVGGAIALFGAIFGGIVGTLTVLVALVVTAPAVGAFVEPWVENYRNRRAVDLSAPGAGGGKAAPPVPPVPPVPPTSPVAPAQPQPQPWAMQDVPIVAAAAAAPVQETRVSTEPEIDLSAVEGEAIGLRIDDAGAASTPLTAVDTVSAVSIEEGAADLLKADEAPMSADAGVYTFTLPESQPTSDDASGLTVDDLVTASDADVAAAQAAEAARRAEAQRAAGEPPAGDDFTRIQGVGRSADRKLRAAGILTFAQLAAAPAEMVAAILGVRVEEVIEDEIQKQAHTLAA